jgi:IS30 family transposase
LAAGQQREHDGLLRQYLPRTVNMRDYDQAEFDAIADRTQTNILDKTR